jgi:hypothetical protein
MCPLDGSSVLIVQVSLRLAIVGRLGFTGCECLVLGFSWCVGWLVGWLFGWFLLMTGINGILFY